LPARPAAMEPALVFAVSSNDHSATIRLPPIARQECAEVSRFLALDHDDHFIEKPAIGWLMTALSKTSSVDATEMQKPPTHGFIGDIEPAFCKKLFNVAKAEGKASHTSRLSAE